ncbi:hypothetical protein [Deinococcus sp.]|uniref:hypothetical protein n=1 Tax=Deinococcus sp. TaxID=47478 RepID=UPI003CC67112
MQTAERYIGLAHGLDAHSPGSIDGYGGPAEWAERTLRPLATLRAEAGALAESVAAEPNASRRGFLEAQLRAMHTKLRLLSGERLAYRDEVRGLYDIEVAHTPEGVFEEALTRLDAALPGTGSFYERQERLRARVALERGDILRLAGPILAELRGRTARRFGLPEGEDFNIELVQDKPWGGYNWPLGNFQSRIDINTDLPVLLPTLPDLLAHEGYPGHHTEHAVKEGRLVRGRGWQEHGLQLINAPECVVSEGIAVNALRAVMDERELHDWLTGDLSKQSGLDADDVAAYLSAAAAQEVLAAADDNAALLLHGQERPEAEVIDYLTTAAARSPERARQTLAFLKAPLSRSYSFNYRVGGRLVREAVSRGTFTFAQLLSEPVTPGELAE